MTLIRPEHEAKRHIDLVHWLLDRRHARTSGAALKMIADGRVMVDSHPMKDRYIDAGHRKALRVRD